MRIFNKERYFESLARLVTKDTLLYSSCSVLITGANGLIGGTLLDFLMYLNQEYSANIRITVLVRSELEKHLFFDYNDITILTQSVTDKIDFKGNLDYIFHAASNAHPKAYDLYPVETALTNVQGTANILALAKETESKVIFVSSSEVYGELSPEKKEHEENTYGPIDILSPRSCYSESKRMAENLVSSYIKEYDLSGVIVRPAYIYGARFSEQNTRADVEFIKNCLSKKDIVMKSEGLQMRSYCYVLDCIFAMLIVGLRGKNGEAYNISSDSGNVKLVDFARNLTHYSDTNLLFDLVGVKGGSTILNSLLSNQKIKSIGWNEIFSLSDGIQDTFSILMN